jgi:hypothetical protein
VSWKFVLVALVALAGLLIVLPSGYASPPVGIAAIPSSGLLVEKVQAGNVRCRKLRLECARYWGFGTFGYHGCLAIRARAPTTRLRIINPMNN